MLISKKYGTFLALGGIVTDVDIKQDAAEEPNRCHDCNKCQQACPLGALEQPYVLDREKCLSSLLQTEQLPESARSVMRNRVMDCEICQQACPWNARHIENPLPTETTIAFQNKIPAWEDFFYLANLVKLTEREYRETLGPLNTGIPYAIFHSNVLLAMEGLHNP